MTYNRAIRYLEKKFGKRRPPFDELEFNDQRIVLLIEQYYYGISVKKELENLLDELKIE
jgi:hypothetical protein